MSYFAMDQKIEPAQAKESFFTVSADELRQIKPANLGNNVVGFHIGINAQNEARQFANALGYHGFYGQVTDNDGDYQVQVDFNELRHQEALQAIKTADPDYRGGAIGYGFGPEPAMVPLDIGKTLDAQEQLDQNGHVTTENADTLVQWIAQKAKNELFSKGQDTSPQQIRGACGFGQGLVGYAAENMGIKTAYHQIASLSEFSTARHAFNILTIPVADEQTGAVTDKLYLIDTTFRQFFASDRCSFSGGATMRDWGSSLVQTDEGRHLANKLLTHGYAELTEERARLYVNAQIGVLDETANSYEPGAWEAHDPFERLKQSTVENDYSRAEFKEWGIDVASPKQMMAAQSATEKPSIMNRFTSLFKRA